MDNKQEKIRSSLKKDSDTVFENQLERAEGLLSYDDEGRGRSEVESDIISRDEEVYLATAGCWFASEGGDREKPTVGSEELAQVTEYGRKSVSADSLSSVFGLEVHGFEFGECVCGSEYFC